LDDNLVDENDDETKIYQVPAIKSTYMIKLRELHLDEISNNVDIDNARIRLLNTNLCFFWQGFSYTIRNTRISYSIELHNCDSISSNNKYGHFKIRMKLNETSGNYNALIHSEIGQQHGCFGSSISSTLAAEFPKNREDIKEYVYLRYCSTANYPDYSTHWTFRPAVYTEEVDTSWPIDESKDKIKFNSISLGEIQRIPSVNTKVSETFVYRLENVINDTGEEYKFCIVRTPRGVLKLTECGPKNPSIAQWFELLHDEVESNKDEDNNIKNRRSVYGRH